jgi:hypothetical protein
MFASRRHAWVWRQGDRVIVEDLASTNGTYVNGQRIVRPRFLLHNDVLVMGDGQLTFTVARDPSTDFTPPQGTPQAMVGQDLCPYCGTGNHPQASSCAQCGRTLGSDAGPGSKRGGGGPFTPTEPVVAQPFPVSRATPKRRTETGVWLLILLLAIIAVAFLTIMGVLVFYVVS